jgi:hypothetical protein
MVQFIASYVNSSDHTCIDTEFKVRISSCEWVNMVLKTTATGIFVLSVECVIEEFDFLCFVDRASLYNLVNRTN